ncbi:PREDICTED: uncharacterized protein LOC101300502 [Fragaria vesca subsp. vesca]|uniref:uncharacterized protein LOC101300502 n=1 Tax=Fragaria vesca subsp. vesca TaxID=101020 RepID=UPI0002C32A5B|nr:PREDICTED: uncharacterized protein LOC101300502 [Fragaria vesca subsp. vesca]
MISVLAQERLLGAAAGSIVTAIVVFDQRRSIYSSISGTKPESVAQYRRIEPLFGRKSCSELAHLWNKAVDETFRPVIESLTSSGW